MFDKFDYFNRGYIFGVKTDKYKPYINYDWSTTTASGLRYLKDVGSTPTYNASMYFGRGAYFNGVDQGVTFNTFSPLSENTILFNISNIGVASDLPLMASNSYANYRIMYSYTSGDYWSLSLDLRQFGGNILTTGYILPKNTNCQICIKEIAGVISIYANNEVVKVFNATLNGGIFNQLAFSRLRSQYSKFTIKDLSLFNRTLTQSEITRSYEQPELFYAMAQADSTCVLNMPMCETSSTVRNYKTGIDHPITNYTSSVRDNAKNLQYGLQTCKFVRDSLGVIQSASDYLECDKVGYADTGWMPSASEDWTIECIAELGTTSSGFVFGFNKISQVNDRIRFVSEGAINFISCFNGFSKTASGYTGLTGIVLRFNKSTGIVDLFMNKIFHSTSSVIPISSGLSIFLAARNYNGTTVDNHYNKQIAKFKVHNKALTNEEIQAL